MTVEKEMRRTNSWVRRRINPKRAPKPEQPIQDYEFQIPPDWLDNLALWAKMMLFVITAAVALGYFVTFMWVIDHVGYYR